MKTLICLIGGQLAPNLLDLLYTRPQKLILVHTSATKEEAVTFSDYVYERYNVDAIELSAVDAFDLNLIQQKAHELFTKEASSELVLNYTGGTKQMSIGFYSVAMQLGVERSYVDSQNKLIYVFSNEHSKKEKLDINLGALDWIALSNIQIKKWLSLQDIESYRYLVYTLYKYRVKSHTPFYKAVFAPAVAAGDRKSTVPFIPNYIDKKLTITTDLSVENNPITVQLGATVFAVTDNLFWRDFFAGKWFEIWAALALIDSQLFDDVIVNVELLPSEAVLKRYNFNADSIKNELDIVAVKNNIPFLIECKTGIIDQKAVTNLKASLDVYFPKYAKAFLLKLSKKMSDELMEKCASYTIEVIDVKSFNHHFPLEMQTELIKK
jgi:hypothetical protein